MNGFTLIADPTRRRILDVLRDAGAVTATIAGKRRVYRLSAELRDRYQAIPG